MRTAYRHSPTQWTAAWLLFGAAAVPGADSAALPLPGAADRPAVDEPCPQQNEGSEAQAPQQAPAQPE